MSIYDLRNAIRQAERAMNKVAEETGGTGTYNAAENFLDVVREVVGTHTTGTGENVYVEDYRKLTENERGIIENAVEQFTTKHNRIIKQMQRERGRASHYATKSKQKHHKTWKDVAAESFFTESEIFAAAWDYYHDGDSTTIESVMDSLTEENPIDKKAFGAVLDVILYLCSTRKIFSYEESMSELLLTVYNSNKDDSFDYIEDEEYHD